MFSLGIHGSNPLFLLKKKKELRIPGLSVYKSHRNTDGVLIAVVSRS